MKVGDLVKTKEGTTLTANCTIMKVGDLVKTKKEGIIGVIVGETKTTGGAIGYSGDVFAVAIVPSCREEMILKHPSVRQTWDFYPSQLELLR